MSLTAVFLMLLVLYLSPESVTTASGQVQTADAIRTLKETWLDSVLQWRKEREQEMNSIISLLQ